MPKLIKRRSHSQNVLMVRWSNMENSDSAEKPDDDYKMDIDDEEVFLTVRHLSKSMSTQRSLSENF